MPPRCCSLLILILILSAACHPATLAVPGCANSVVYMRARLLYPRTSPPLNKLPAGVDKAQGTCA
jgi:hypothetical protein